MTRHPSPANAANSSERDISAVAEKWGTALVAGYQIIPNVLFAAQSRLELDAVDCVILLNLNLFWWKKDDFPFPPPTLIAKRMGVSRRTVERRLLKLEAKGWLKRLPAIEKDGNPKIRKYDLSGMAKRLQVAAISNLNYRNYRADHPSERNRLLSERAVGTGRKQLLLDGGTETSV
jgi:hypothetical protein